jgi:hypothetical protein
MTSGIVDPAVIRLMIFAEAQAGDYSRVGLWASRLPSFAAAAPSSPDAAFLPRLASVIAGYAVWSQGLSAPPALRFFDEDDESEDARFLRKALLACAEGLFQRALRFLSTLVFKADLVQLRSVALADVEALQARICATLGIDRDRLGTGPERGVLLIRSHSSGFVADLFHVAIQLVVAELARRRPLVHWGQESAYWRPESDNLWTDFFEPIGMATLADIARDARSFYPSFFGKTNLSASQNSPWFRNLDGSSHETILGRSEDVAVVERFSTLPEILSLLPAHHAWRKVQPLALLRSVFARFIKVRADLVGGYADWLRENALGQSVVAVHYRLQSSHKVAESTEKRLVPIERYFEYVDAFLARDSAARIFLLTDYEPAIEAFQRRYPGRVFCSDAERLKLESVAEVQLGLTRTVGNHHLAREVVRDFATAALCRYFVLDGASNVSTAIYCLAPAVDDRVAWVREPALGVIWTGERILPRLVESGPRTVDLVSRL